MRAQGGGEWQRWKGAWWVKVGRQNLNSRKRRQNLRGLRRLIARRLEEMIGVLEELQNQVRAESEGERKRCTATQIIIGR